MRAVRKALPDQAERSHRLWALVQALPAMADAGVVMVFDSVPGEPITQPFIDWCGVNGKQVVLPEDDPSPDPAMIDVMVVPGIAFTARGDRLGQGGGWYDRFLSQVRSECVTIGVCFEPQIVDDLPTEPHDVALDIVVTDEQVYLASR